MHSLWNDSEASLFADALGQRVYTSRLLGRNPALVMHGGGNTSVKTHVPDLFGRMQHVLYVKGSGWDLATIERPGFTPLRMDAVLELATLEQLSDVDMANALRTASIDANAPMPSVEAILHALLPYPFVDHTHADAIIALTNTPNGREHIERVYGERVVIIPYVMPGFKLARLVYEEFPKQAHDGTVGIILLNHGIFTFGATARESYERMIALVTEAEDYIAQFPAADHAPTGEPPAFNPAELAEFRAQVAAAAGFPVIITAHDDDHALAFARRPDVTEVAQQGPLTPDHVIRTKRLPLVGRAVAAYAEAYRAYFAAHADRAAAPLTMLDPAPRVILDPAWGLLTIGRTAGEAQIGADIYQHTIDVIETAERLGGYRALPPEDIFDVEYWDLEQAKLRKAGSAPEFTGEIALVTGGASGIGRACVDELLARGAAVVALDVNPAVEGLIAKPGYFGVQCDVADEAALTGAVSAAVRRFGGLDMLILNAGIFPAGKRIADLPLAEWDRVLRINLDANLALLSQTHPLLKRAPRGGRVVIVGSKNVPAPGPGAAAYSASKAALTQLARVAALEWGGDNIRINTVHPNAVFDTGLWTDDVLANRAQHYGMTVEQYKTNNVLKIEVTSRDVARLVAAMCGSAFRCTTGAQVPVDGGNERVI
ncbi:MAG: bifunctional aldolase/short-chain dehydrogenase [Anaerolinea sp.]|nr:bifunctional aldolase/short-chain dehydrogenase [Anaerolinea sp.]